MHAPTVALGQGSTTLQPIDENATSMLTKVCENINSKLHDQANKLIAADSVKPHNIDQLNVDAFIDDLDPTIWKAVCLITQPSNKKLTYIRKIRTVFAQCQLNTLYHQSAILLPSTYTHNRCY